MRIMIWTLGAFLVGSIPFSVLLGHLILRTDVRRFGDGNPGAINAWRAGGWHAGLPALLLDYLKGAVPVTLAHYGAGITGWALVPIALAPVVGHAFSPWLHFRGGKAIAATFGIWTGLTLWVGPTTMGLALAAAMLIQRTDAWSAMAGMPALLAALLLGHFPTTFLLVWAGNLAVLYWRHRKELRTAPQLRPWLRRLGRRSA